MTEHDSTEIAYKRGYAEAVKDIFEKIDSILSVDISHSYMSDNFVLSQSKYVQIKKEFFDKSADYNSLIPVFELGAKSKTNYKETVYKNLDDFREKHCMMCGSQLCAGPNDEFADGCNYLKAAIFVATVEDDSKPIQKPNYDNQKRRRFN